LRESDGHRFASIVVLHGNHCRFGRAPFLDCFQPHAVVELERQCRKKDCVLRSAKFYDRRFA
jgi:hypothetical protein